MLTVVVEELLSQLVGVVRELLKQDLEVLFADGLTEHRRMCLVNEVVSFVKDDLEAANRGRFSETHPVEWSFVNFVADVIRALLNKDHL